LVSPPFSVAGIRAAVERRQAEKAAAERAARDHHAAEQATLHAAFEKQELPPDTMAKVEAAVRRAIELGDHEALVFRFPSDYMTDSGRSLSSHIGDWRAHLTGLAARAVDFYDRELAPLGFELRAGIVDYQDGIPGDAGFWLRWD
jgi:hypothetical protein